MVRGLSLVHRFGDAYTGGRKKGHQVMNGLTFSERNIFTCLQSREGELVSREDILTAMYPPNNLTTMNPSESNSIEVLISRVRRKTGRSIKAKRGQGYILEPLAEVTASESRSTPV